MPPAVRHLSLTARAACALVALTGAVVLGGWILGQPALRDIVPGTVEMQALTAVGLLCASLSLLGALQPGDALRWPCRALALVPLALGVLVLAQYLLGWRLGIDDGLLVDGAGFADPGRFAPPTAVNLVLVGAALLTLDSPPRHGWRPAELLVLPAALVACVGIIGYAYGIPAFHGPGSVAKMGLSTAVCFLALGIAVTLARPHGHVLRLATTEDPGGILMRRLAPLAVAVPLLLGWLRLKAVEGGVVTDRVGMWWLTMATIACFLALISRVAARLSAADADRRAMQSELVRLANHDFLTGLHNRHRFDQELARARSVLRRYGRETTLLILDLDHLKPVNDAHGHRVGDALLRAVAAVLRQRLRESDVAARLGGDEFGILLPETDPLDATALADRILREIRACRIPSDSGAGCAWTTASIGIATLHGEASVDVTLGQADAAMYAAKRAGGDRFALAGAEVELPRAAQPARAGRSPIRT